MDGVYAMHFATHDASRKSKKRQAEDCFHNDPCKRARAENEQQEREEWSQQAREYKQHQSDIKGSSLVQSRRPRSKSRGREGSFIRRDSLQSKSLQSKRRQSQPDLPISSNTPTLPLTPMSGSPETLVQGSVKITLPTAQDLPARCEYIHHRSSDSFRASRV